MFNLPLKKSKECWNFFIRIVFFSQGTRRALFYPTHFVNHFIYSENVKNGFYLKFWKEIYFSLEPSTAWGNDHEVKSHEIEIHFFMRLKLNLFMRSNFLSPFMRSKFLIIDSISWSRHFSWDQNCLIMLFRVSISWSIC